MTPLGPRVIGAGRLAFSVAQGRSEPRSASRSEPWTPLGAATGRVAAVAPVGLGDRWLWELGSPLADGMGRAKSFRRTVKVP